MPREKCARKVPNSPSVGSRTNGAGSARIPSEPAETDADDEDAARAKADSEPSAAHSSAAHSTDAPLTIGEAKRRLALSLGVDPSNIRITVEA